jgi:hypothetical protein
MKVSLWNIFSRIVLLWVSVLSVALFPRTVVCAPGDTRFEDVPADLWEYLISLSDPVKVGQFASINKFTRQIVQDMQLRQSLKIVYRKGFLTVRSNKSNNLPALMALKIRSGVDYKNALNRLLGNPNAKIAKMDIRLDAIINEQTIEQHGLISQIDNHHKDNLGFSCVLRFYPEQRSLLSHASMHGFYAETLMHSDQKTASFRLQSFDEQKASIEKFAVFVSQVGAVGYIHVDESVLEYLCDGIKKLMAQQKRGALEGASEKSVVERFFSAFFKDSRIDAKHLFFVSVGGSSMVDSILENVKRLKKYRFEVEENRRQHLESVLSKRGANVALIKELFEHYDPAVRLNNSLEALLYLFDHSELTFSNWSEYEFVDELKGYSQFFKAVQNADRDGMILASSQLGDMELFCDANHLAIESLHGNSFEIIESLIKMGMHPDLAVLMIYRIFCNQGESWPSQECRATIMRVLAYGANPETAEIARMLPEKIRNTAIH